MKKRHKLIHSRNRSLKKILKLINQLRKMKMRYSVGTPLTTAMANSKEHKGTPASREMCEGAVLVAGAVMRLQTSRGIVRGRGQSLLY